MSFCTQCGTQLAAGARFCTGCGAPVAAAPTAPQPSTPPQSGYPDHSDEATHVAGASAPITQKLPTSGAKPHTPDEDATQFAPVQPPHQGYRSAAPQSSAQVQPDADTTQFAPVQPPQQGYPSQGYPSAAPQQGYASAAPQQGYASTAPQPAAPQQGYASSAPYASTAPHAQAPHLGQQPPYASAAPQGQRGPSIALDWKPLIPGLLRLAAAVALAMTALGNWWTISNDSADHATHSFVLPLIGCIGVALAAVVQIALLPQFLGGALPAIARLGVRAALCLPALVAIVMALVTTLGGFDSDKFSSVGVTMLAMAAGFVLIGLDDAHEALPADALRWVTVAMAALGVALVLLSIVQVLNADDYDGPTGKEKWLLAVVSLLFVAVIAGLVIWVALARPSFGHGLLAALAAAGATSIVTHGWFQADQTLYLITIVRNGHGAPLVALALALATAATVSGIPGDTAMDAPSAARRLTAWVVPGYAVAAVAALVTALVFIGARGDETPGGETWFLVLMFITALAYGACAFLLRTHPMGRVVAVGTTLTLALTILITMAAAKNVGSTGEMFTEGAYLWLPLIAAGALTIPPSVRAVAGPIMPNRPAAQAAPAPQGEVR